MNVIGTYRRATFIFSLLAVSSSLLVAQNFRMRFDHVSVEEGLSNFTPVVITQDKIGFLWIGTEDGLNKYDGNTFRIYRPNPGDSSSLDGGIVVGLLCDRDGDLWVTSQGDGFFRYDRNSDAFQKFRIPVYLKEQRFVSGGLLQSRDGLIWVLSNDGAYIFEKHSHTFRRTVHTSTHPNLTTNALLAIAQDSSGVMWIGTDQGVNSFDPRTNVVKGYRLESLRRKKTEYRSVSALQVDKQGNLWATTIGGLLRFNRSSDAFEPVQFTLRNGYPIGENITISLHVDSRGKVWTGTMGDGLVEFDPATNTYRQHFREERDSHSLLNNRITTMFEDRSGVFWVGNYRAGLNRYIKRQAQFIIYRMESFVYSVLEEPDGDVWFGSTDGLYRSRFDGMMPTLYTDKSPTEFRLTNPQVEALARDSKGDLWIGHGKGIDRLSKKTNRVRRYLIERFAASPTLGRTVKALAIDRDGDVWAGIDQGSLCIYDPKQDRFKEFVPKHRKTTETRIPSVWSIYADSSGRIWFATFGAGLFCYIKRTETLTQFVSNPNDSASLRHNALYFVRESSDRFIWAGTFGGGVMRYDPRSGHFKAFTVANGLPDNFVKGMLEDEHGFLWFSTDKGLSRYDSRTNVFKNYREKDGLHTNVFLSGAYHKGASGLFYFGGEHGVTVFHPDSMKENVYAPSIIITSFKVFEELVPPLGGFVPDSTLTKSLGYRENSFSFEFISADFSAPDKNQFAFKLEGLDNDWIQAGTRRYARYTHVPAGEYVFRVKGTNSDGVWSPNVASMRVVVVPPPWERWWFRIGAAVLLLGLGFALYNYRVNRLLEIERLRVRIASDLHDDIGSSLTKISLQSELIQEDVEPDEQQNYLKNIAAMSRELVTSMSDIVWSIDSRNDTIENLLDKMKSFAGSTLSARDIGFTLAHSGIDMKKKISVDVRQNIYLIFKEAINNVAKHANASSVRVVIRNDTDKFTMAIADNGKGWEGKERPTGHGTKNMKMRAERLGGTVEFVGDEGTRVVLTMARI